MWILDGKGEFSVKSCYRQMVEEYATPDATFWRKLWTLELPGKVRFFLWRTCRLCLPTATLLREKRVNIDSKCAWCRLEIESIEHVLFECEFARQVWNSVGLEDRVQINVGESTMDLFKRLFSNVTKQQCVLFFLLCWNIWN